MTHSQSYISSSPEVGFTYFTYRFANVSTALCACSFLVHYVWAGGHYRFVKTRENWLNPSTVWASLQSFTRMNDFRDPDHLYSLTLPLRSPQALGLLCPLDSTNFSPTPTLHHWSLTHLSKISRAQVVGLWKEDRLLHCSATWQNSTSICLFLKCLAFLSSLALAFFPKLLA